MDKLNALLILIAMILLVILYVLHDERDLLIHEFKCSEYESGVCVEYRRVRP